MKTNTPRDAMGKFVSFETITKTSNFEGFREGFLRGSEQLKKVNNPQVAVIAITAVATAAVGFGISKLFSRKTSWLR